MPGVFYLYVFFFSRLYASCNPIIYALTNTEIFEGYKNLFRTKTEVKKSSNLVMDHLAVNLRRKTSADNHFIQKNTAITKNGGVSELVNISDDGVYKGEII